MGRLKHRYVLAKIVFKPDNALYHVKEHSLLEAVRKAVEHVHGSYGLSGVDIGLHVKYLNEYTKFVLIRVRRQFHTQLLSSLPFIRAIQVEQTGSSKGKGKILSFIQVLHVTGTIRCAQKFIIKHHETKKQAMIKSCTTQEECEKVMKMYTVEVGGDREEEEDESSDED